MLDVTDLTCPMTWVRTKLELEKLAPGETPQSVQELTGPRLVVAPDVRPMTA